MNDNVGQTTFFYSRRPISADIILAKLQAARGHLRQVRPEELWSHDQDHYGGLAANDALAETAGIGAGARVADFCAGLGGPARYLAHRYGADVTGIELTPARVEGAARLTALVGLEDRVRVLHGDVMAPPLDDGSMDAVVSQEAFLHVPDKTQTLASARAAAGRTPRFHRLGRPPPSLIGGRHVDVGRHGGSAAAGHSRLSRVGRRRGFHGRSRH